VVEDAGEFEAGDGGDLVVVAAGEAVGGRPAEEGAELAGAGWDAVGEFLVGEGAGEEEGWGGCRLLVAGCWLFGRRAVVCFRNR
jgi:hypothetical protein